MPQKVNNIKEHNPLEERLSLDGDYGEINFGTLKLPAICCLNTSTDEEINEMNPATFMVPGDGRSVMAWVHRSVPANIQDVVLFHELVEAELAVQYGMPLDMAHRVSFWFEKEYAQTFLGEDERRTWADFRHKVGDKSAPLSKQIEAGRKTQASTASCHHGLSSYRNS